MTHQSQSSFNHTLASSLLLSQASVAVLLAFAAAAAQAADLPGASAEAQPGAAMSVNDVQSAPLSASASQPATSGNSVAPAAPGNAPASSAPGGNLGVGAAPTGPGATAPVAAPQSVEFNTQFFSGTGAASTDISRFNKGNAALPGRYRAALYVNGVWIGVTDVTLREIDGQKSNVQPLFDRDLLTRAGVDIMRLPEAASAKLDAVAKGNGVVLLPDLIPQATAAFDPGEQRLDLSIPQAALSRNARGWVDPKYWDDGVTAATLQYNANVYHTNGSGFSTTQGYLGLNAGLNVGAWRFRYNGNVTSQTDSGTHVQSMQTYLQRSFTPIKSELTLGDSYTDGEVFDSFGVRGVQLGTDDRMYPESQRGYAPTVRGIANTNAKVQVKQNGNIIYETTVAPGPFEINDLYPTGYGGDLQVVVTEADGSQHVSSVPYAAPVNALREGRWRYSVTAGEYRDTSINSHPFVFEGTLQHGLNNFVTLYGGLIGATGYVAGEGGVAVNTPLGAFAVDLTQANTNIPSMPSRSGQSLRLSYSRVFAPTDTDVTLAAYRYSTSGYLSLADAMNMRDYAQRGIANTYTGIQKGRLQLTLNQTLGSWGSVYASGYVQNYWDRSGTDTSFQVGYNTNIRRVGVGVSASRAYDTSTSRWDNRYMLNLNIPLDIGSTVANTSTSYTHDSLSNTDQIQESFTGAAGKDNQINYGATAGYTTGGQGASVNANAGYLAPFTQARVNAGYANGYTQVGGGLSGSVVAYEGGVALSSQTGDTLAVVEAKDAVGARVASAPGVVVDTHGHAVIGGMMPYQLNNAEIDTKGLPMGVELKSTEQHFAPTSGAVVRVKFDTEYRGQAVIMSLRRPNGDAVPFGADVLDGTGNSVGTVTQGSRAMFFSKQAANDLTVKWGEGIGQSCKVHYDMPVAKKGEAMTTQFADASCQ
jgi:outer membrane usher protein